MLDAADDAGLRIEPLDAPRRAGAPAARAEPPVTSWGDGRDLRDVERARRRRPGLDASARAELRALAAARDRADRALRELLALQSSDWAFLITPRPPATTRPSARTATRRRSTPRWRDRRAEPALRNLAPHLAAGALASP